MRPHETCAASGPLPDAGLWAHYRRLLADPLAPALTFVGPASYRSPHPNLMSLDLVDYGVRKCINATLTGVVLLMTAPLASAISTPIEAVRQVHGVSRLVAVPLAVLAGLAMGCLAGVANLGVRGMGACFGAAAALMGAACFPMDVTGTALEQLAASCP